MLIECARTQWKGCWVLGLARHAALLLFSPKHRMHVHCRLIKEFEREGRTDGMPARELADRKRGLVTELNNFIALKKSYSATEQGRNELMDGAAPKLETLNDGACHRPTLGNHSLNHACIHRCFWRWLMCNMAQGQGACSRACTCKFAVPDTTQRG